MADIEQISNDEFFLYVVDPNPVGKDMIPPEDLTMYVNFRALPKSRSVVETDGTFSTDAFSVNGVEMIATSTENGKQYVTTDYSNVGGGNPHNNENFGIRNIELSYGASMVPQVDIEFVDVRGAALFNDYERVNSDNEVYNASYFGVFFQQPYPLFELTVKGHYGKAVSYCLHLRKVNQSFESSTGNYVLKCEFVGYTFAFLADLLMGYVSALSSSKKGQDLLASKGSIPIDNLLGEIGQLTRIGEEFKKSSENFEELKVINTLVFKLDKLSKLIGLPVTKDIESIYGNTLPISQLLVNSDQLFIQDIALISVEKSDIHDVVIQDIAAFVADYNSFIKSNKNKYSFLAQFEIQNFNIKTPADSYVVSSEMVDIITTEVNKIGFNTSSNLISVDLLLSRLSLPSNSSKEFYIINYHSFRKEVNELLSKAKSIKEKEEIEVNEELNNVLIEQVGFDLSIRSIISILLANVEVFLELLYNTALDADRIDIQQDRISKLTNVKTDIKEGEGRIYPFPLVVDSTTGEDVWLGDVVGESNPYFPELELVKDIINNLVARSGGSTSQENININGNNTSSKDLGWVGINPLDYTNPYTSISNVGISQDISTSVAESIVDRAVVTYNYTQINTNFQKMAEIDAAIFFDTLENDTSLAALKQIDEGDFISQLISKSNFSIEDSYILNNYNFEDGIGVLIENYDAEYSSVIARQDENLSENTINVINGFSKPIEDIILPTKLKNLHRKLDRISLNVVGDFTDSLWNDEIKNNIANYHRSLYSERLINNQTYNYTISSIISDLGVFDGKIYNSNTSKPQNKDEKYTNISRKYIYNNIIGDGILSNQEYYNNANNAIRAYFMISTLPIDNITDLLELFKISGTYSLTYAQLVWVSAQFFRAASQTNGDLIDNYIASLEINQVSKNALIEFSNGTKNFLPNLDDYSSGFVDRMIDYFVTFINGYFLFESNPFEEILSRYGNFTLNTIKPNSQGYTQYKKDYAGILEFLTFEVKIIIVAPSKIFSSITTKNRITGSNTLNFSTLSSYLGVWLSTFKSLNREQNRNEQQNNEFSSENGFYLADKDFKIATYKHLKTIYDKWIGGSDDGRIYNACKAFKGNNNTDSLIDKFFFIDRAWNDIGSRANINPKGLLVLSNNRDISFYSLLGRIMQDSKFSFFVLPSWVNYKNLDDVQQMWEPTIDVNDISVGASYVCMYMGGESKVLDIKRSAYVNDGFDLRTLDYANIPNDFIDRVIPDNIDELNEQNRDRYNMTAFRVSYADQNQSIFKAIDPTQEEHRETAESLYALSENYDNRGGTKQIYKGTNLYNVYQNRSYKCTVTSAGNMQIHPLSYFQLDNVPFYHGAYLITKVHHSIKPHNISTKFEGRRIPRFITPIVDRPTSYINIPLSETLLSLEEQNEAIVRPFVVDRDADQISDGENSFMVENGDGIATRDEIERSREAGNVLLEVKFGTRSFTFWIEEGLTSTEANARINRIYNPNAPAKFKGVGLGDCYGWTKRSLKEIGVIQDEFYGIDAWTFFQGWDAGNTYYVSEDDFSRNLSGWSNESIRAAGIPDGSFIACYHPNSKYILRAYDVMNFHKVTNTQLQRLGKFKSLDSVVRNKKFVYSEYKKTHDNIRKKWLAAPSNNSNLQFIPVTHSCVYINGHCFHQLRDTITRPSNTMRIVAYYPFKDKLLQKLGDNVGNFNVNNINQIDLTKIPATNFNFPSF